MFWVCQSPVEALKSTSGHLQLYCQRTMTTVMTTVPVHPTLVQLHLHLWEKTISVSLGTVDLGNSNGTLMTLCGTNRGVQIGALGVIAVIHGSLPH